MTLRISNLTPLFLAASTIYFGEAAVAQPWTPEKMLESHLATHKTVVLPFIAKHCVSCHGPKVQEGELALDTLEADMKTSASASRWAVVLQKLNSREMPPEGRKQPSDDEIKAVVAWIQAEMKRSNKSVARREAYANGNRVDHDKLFDPKFAAKFDNPGQIRRLSPEIYAGFLNDLARGAAGLGQPFTPEGRFTFKDMGAPKIDEPTTVQLIRNAIQIVEKQTAFKIDDGQVKGIGFIPKEFVVLLDENKPLQDGDIRTAIQLQFRAVLARQPTAEEQVRFADLLKKNVKDAGRVTGVRYALAAVFLLPEAVYRWELGAGVPDAQGRIRLAPREIAFALAYALTDKRPEAWLLADADTGKLDTTAGVAAAVQKMLDDPKSSNPRIQRFFREYFGYEKAREVFQDDKNFPDHDSRALVEDTDRLVEYILEQDKNVLAELLSTTKSFVGYKTAADTKKKRLEAVAKFEQEKAKSPEKFVNKTLKLPGRSVYLAYNLKDFPDRQPVDLPASERAGILTQPAWLAANAKTDENHAIFRGKWVRERLLGGVVPDLPITVDAQLPVAPHQSLRERMNVTRADYCWKCHIHMNPVGLPFEVFDHFGRFRTTEPLVDLEATAKNVDKKGKPLGNVIRPVPVDASGSIDRLGDPRVEGKVDNAVEMLRKLATSKRVEQVFVRHAFRYWTGRNETLGDGPSLQQIHKAYEAGGGSLKAMLVALLTSDSFLYRVPTTADYKTP